MEYKLQRHSQFAAKDITWKIKTDSVGIESPFVWKQANCNTTEPTQNEIPEVAGFENISLTGHKVLMKIFQTTQII
ncbi:MAG: hypothetical protein R3A13_03850 [Bdellovibrionota bacterium]